MAIIWPENDGEVKYWEGEYLTTKGAAKALGVTPQTIRNYIKDQRYPNPRKKIEGGRHYYLFSRKKVIEIEAKTRELRGQT
ncbi:hypothetical protein [Roseospira visakhapatnamensis]|uniref:DNA-binding transcriptional MerR regulator n=1 Tax=Roseospira visakhapatnamensis TaxID=390880 RepID=A0A7W6RFY6_9PROT|nr:hypothetical protein [Roseospira visakhapatnamensis]MBB4267836.1 DNA-binding transcriptional MerR regulator [Roseospira visakhapatnamensis]